MVNNTLKYTTRYYFQNFHVNPTQCILMFSMIIKKNSDTVLTDWFL